VAVDDIKTTTRYPQMRRLGFVFLVAGFAIVPIGFTLIALLKPDLTPDQTLLGMIGLFVFAGGGMTGGIALIDLDAHLRSNSS
jgi:hypothetical protein